MSDFAHELFLDEARRKQILISNPPSNSAFMAHSHLRLEACREIINSIKTLSQEQLTVVSPFDHRPNDQEHFLDSALYYLGNLHSFCADLSDGNLNVIFEFGMAIGLGIPTQMFYEDQTDLVNEIPLLRDIRHSKVYSGKQPDNTNLSVERVKSFIEDNLPRNRSETTTKPFMLFKSELKRINDISVYAPSKNATFLQQLELTISKNCYSLEWATEYEMTSSHPNTKSLLLRVANSYCNTFLFPSTNDTNALEILRGLCLLAGYSYGLGKKTICIVPEIHSDFLSDIRNSSIVIHNELELESALASYYNSLATYLASDLRESFFPVVSPYKYKLSKDVIDAGGQIAEKDYLLSRLADKIVPPGSAESFLARPIIIGPKGSGKTALCTVIADQLAEEHDNNVLYIGTTDDDMELLNYLLKDKSALKRLDIFRMMRLSFELWRLIVPIYLVYNLLPKANMMPSLLYGRIKQFNDERNEKIGSGGLLYQILIMYKEHYEKYGDDNELDLNITLSKIYYLRKNALNILSDLQKRGFNHIVVIDSVDQLWNIRNAPSLGFLLGLTQYAVDIANKRNTEHSVILSLRNELFSFFMGGYKEPDRIPVHYLKWEESALIELLKDRIRVQLDTETTNQSIDLKEYFVGSHSRFNFLKEMVFDNIKNVPREIIQFFNICRDIALMNRTNGRIDLTIVSEVATKLSKIRCNTIEGEYSYIAPWISSVFEYLRRKVKGFSEDKINNVIIDVVTMKEQLKSVLKDQEVYTDKLELVLDSSDKAQIVIDRLCEFDVLTYNTSDGSIIDNKHIRITKLYALGLLHN
jgi:hypothetical protein